MDRTRPEMSDIPMVIIAYNNLFFVRRFVDQVRRMPNPIVILDNNSTYAPLLEWYAAAERELEGRLSVRRMDRNYGHRVHERVDLPPVYLLSDPDLDLNPRMPVDVAERLLRVSERHGAYKTGLALDISEPHTFIKKDGCGDLVLSIETRYYSQRVDDPEYVVYQAPVDTTFCLVNAAYDKGVHVRVGGDFTAKHLPWYEGYLLQNVPRDELDAWRTNNVSSSILKYVDFSGAATA